jgi:[protein-PII] uridylyltransferase
MTSVTHHEAIEQFTVHREQIRLHALAGHGGVACAGELSTACDQLLVRLFEEVSLRGFNEKTALIAVGGYGRGTLAHGSDLDLVLLVEDPENPTVHSLAESLFHPLWNARIAIGHAVRSREDCIALARTDIRTATTILDARYIAGDAHYAADVLQDCEIAVFENDLSRFLDELNEETHARHQRFGATVYLLEPDVKQSRGGLRDLDVARWALRARFRAQTFREAHTMGALTAHECNELEEAQEFFWRVRMSLHARTGRRNDRLNFEEQEDIASRIVTSHHHEDTDLAEHLMSQWWSHARDVSTLTEHIVARCHPTRDWFNHVDQRTAEEETPGDATVCFSHPDAHLHDPSLALRTIELAVTRGLPLGAVTRDAIATAARDESWCESLRKSDVAAASFCRLITTSTRAKLRADGIKPVSETESNEGSVVAALHDLGLLLAMVPEFAHVTARVQRDVYHVYTVDVHSVAALDRLHTFARGDSEEFSLPIELMADTERTDLVCLATLLHDIGKSRGAPHSEVGAALAISIATRLGFAPDDAAMISWLVAEHLTLYHAATRRDLGDPATLHALVSSVHDPWRLRALYLLTVADLSTTSPTALTSWKARMLDELYLRVEEALATGHIAHEERTRSLRQQALAYSPLADHIAVEQLLARMPERYTLATTPEAILRHSRALLNVAPATLLVHISPLEGDLSEELYEVLITAPDRPGLLSLFAAMLYVHRMDVQGAHAYSSCGDAVDVFVVRLSHTHTTDPARMSEKLLATLNTLLSGVDLDAWVKASRSGPGISRPEPGVRSEIKIHDAVSEAATVIEVFGRDRPGFLYRVTRTLHRLHLQIVLAKVNTEGSRAADSFYVTDTLGAKLTTKTSETVKTALLATLQEWV